jgi:hypothetical protein
MMLNLLNTPRVVHVLLLAGWYVKLFCPDMAMGYNYNYNLSLLTLSLLTSQYLATITIFQYVRRF